MAIHRPGLSALSARLLGGAGAPEVDDAVQQVFIALVRNADEIRDPGAIGAWLRRTALRTCANIRRERDARRDRERSASAPRTGSPPQSDVLAALDRALADMPDPLRVVVHRHFFEGLDLQDIARDLGEAPATIRKRLQRALADLRRRLSRREAAILGLLLLMGQGWAADGCADSVPMSHASGSGRRQPSTATVAGVLVVAFLVLVVAFAVVGRGPSVAAVTASAVAVSASAAAGAFPAPEIVTGGRPPAPETMHPAVAEDLADATPGDHGRSPAIGRVAAGTGTPPVVADSATKPASAPLAQETRAALDQASRICPMAWCLLHGDRDGNGAIDAAELAAQVDNPAYRSRAVALGVAGWPAERILAIFDRNRDRRVEAVEYLRAFSRQ